MPRIDIQTAYRVRVKGRDYWYAWKGRGAPRLTAKPGSKEFIAQLSMALEGRNKGDRTKIDGLVIAYKASDAFLDLADSTKRNWLRWLDVSFH